MNEEKQAMLPLDALRTVALKGTKQTYTYHLRRVTGDDWMKYFASVVDQTLNLSGSRERVLDTESALLELVDRVLVRAEGYGDLSAIGEWKSFLPMRHRIAVGVVLRSVAAASTDDDVQICNLVEVRLDATWPIDGKTCGYDGLVHRFRHPSIDDLKRFNFEASRIKVRGTGDNGVSIYPSRHAIALKMYDDLIESADGYSIHGEPLTGKEAIVREMDGAHKATAALRLFEGEGDVEVE